MKRLTTDDENSIMFHMNTFFAKNGEVWVRGGGPYPYFKDVTLVEWIRSAAQKHGLYFTANEPEYLADEIHDALQDGDETVEGIIALMHEAAVQAAEMRGRLKLIEDILCEDYELNRLRELVEADRDGRCVVLPYKTIFEPTWDAGPGCDGKCPYCFEPERCDICAKGKLFIYERPCRQEHIQLLGKTVFETREAAESALERKANQ